MSESQAVILRTKLIGAMMREARLSAGKTLREIAALMGIGSGTLSSYERGRKAPSLPELELFAYHLDIPLHRFWLPSLPSSRPDPNFDPRVVLTLRDRMIGARLRAHRNESGLTIRDLAREANLPSGRISAYERGLRAVPLPELELLADILGHSIEEYLDHTGPIGRWASARLAAERVLNMPPDLQAFIGDPDNERYLKLALHLSELPPEKLRSLAEGLMELTQ